MTSYSQENRVLRCGSDGAYTRRRLNLLGATDR